MTRTVFGKELFMTLEEILSPVHAALSLVDPQNDFCSPGGCIDLLNPAVRGVMEPYIERSMHLLEAARNAGVMVIYTQATNDPESIYKSVRIFGGRWSISTRNPPAYARTGPGATASWSG